MLFMIILRCILWSIREVKILGMSIVGIYCRSEVLAIEFVGLLRWQKLCKDLVKTPEPLKRKRFFDVLVALNDLVTKSEVCKWEKPKHCAIHLPNRVLHQAAAPRVHMVSSKPRMCCTMGRHGSKLHIFKPKRTWR